MWYLEIKRRWWSSRFVVSFMEPMKKRKRIWRKGISKRLSELSLQKLRLSLDVETVSSQFSTLASRVFLPLARFWRIRERLCMNRLRSLLSMRGMLLGYTFEPGPNSLVLATAGSVVTIGLSIGTCSHSKRITSLTRENKIDSLVWYSSLGIVIHDIIIRYGESIWPGRSPRQQTELNTWIGNLEPDLLAGKAWCTWVAHHLRVGQSEVNGTMRATVYYYIYSFAYH